MASVSTGALVRLGLGCMMGSGHQIPMADGWTPKWRGSETGDKEWGGGVGLQMDCRRDRRRSEAKGRAQLHI